MLQSSFSLGMTILKVGFVFYLYVELEFLFTTVVLTILVVR